MKKSYDNMLIPYSWFYDLTNKLGSEEPDIALGKERLWMLFESLRNGEQIMTGNPDIDYPVGSLIVQTNKMRKEVTGKDAQIAQLRMQGKTSKEIGGILGMSDGAVRKTSGWKEYTRYAAHSTQAEPVEEKVEEHEHIIIGTDKFNF